jgi:hypothetical protein
MHKSYTCKLFGAVVFRLLIGTAVVAGALANTVACSASEQATGGADAGAGGRDGGGGRDSGGSNTGWTIVPLIDQVEPGDATDVVRRKDQDDVTGIYFESPSRGVIVTAGALRSSAAGGAVFNATGTAVTSVAFSDHNDLNPTNYHGLERTPNGYVAMGRASEVVASVDGGAKFTKQSNGTSFGVETVLAVRVTSTGTTIVKNREIAKSDSQPGAAAVYADVWAPDAIPQVPSTFGAGECHHGPGNVAGPATRYATYVSADRSFLAYTFLDQDVGPEICISNDGGTSFQQRLLDVPDASSDSAPSGVVFTDRMNGILWLARNNAAGTYIKRTTDGGTTWASVPLPTAVASHDLDLPVGFFAGDGQHGWLAGYDFTQHQAVALATTDGGASWTPVAGVGAAVDQAGSTKLYSGFALDATHVWLGGDAGLLMHN